MVSNPEIQNLNSVVIHVQGQLSIDFYVLFLLLLLHSDNMERNWCIIQTYVRKWAKSPKKQSEGVRFC